MSDPLQYLSGLEQFGVKFGLENITAIVAGLDHPERSFKSVHVAGTNGKGSVAAMVDAALRVAGCRSALYTSPHLIALNERFVIHGHPVAADALVAAVALVRDRVEALRAEGALRAHPTFFEVTTAVAFELFRRARVDVAVLEVGLGGRLDATNVVTPAVAAVTSIALDHQQYLGNTVEAIAGEKAGIIKPGVPVVVGDLPLEAMRVVERIAGERGSRLVCATEGVIVSRVASDAGRARIRLVTPVRDYGEVALALRGSHQIHNAVVAVRILEALNEGGTSVPSDAIVSGLAHVVWPGRLDLVRLSDGREAMLDAAHNPAGAAALAAYLDAEGGGKLPLVFAAMGDKDAAGMFRALLPSVERLVVTRASHPRSTDPAALAEQARAIRAGLPVTIEPSPPAALDAAWHQSPRIVVSGSIFLLGDVLQTLHAMRAS